MEITYYTDGVVWVTNQRVVFVRTTYFLRDILSVSVDRYRTDQLLMLWFVSSIAGWLLLLAGIILMVISTLPSALGTLLFSFLLLVFFTLIPLTIHSVQGLFGQPHDNFYSIKFRDARGTNLVYTSFDHEYIQLVAESIDYALQRSSLQSQQTRWLPASGR